MKHSSIQAISSEKIDYLTSVQPEKVLTLNNKGMRENMTTILDFFFARNDRVPKLQLPMKTIDYKKFTENTRSDLEYIWLGHSSLLVSIEGITILTDPLLQRRISPLGPTMFHQKIPLEGEFISEVDAVIISHDHYDHLNKHSIKKLASKTRYFIVPKGVGKYLERWGVDKRKVVELLWWQEFQLDHVKITATPAQHFSGRALHDRNRTLWASWSICGEKRRIFFSGDSGYFSGFSEIGKKCGPFDLTLLECGAYNERWSQVHMFPEQTVQAHINLRGRILQPIHWATFNLALHPWYEPVERLLTAARNENVQLSLPQIGERASLNGESVLNQHWWNEAMDLHILEETEERCERL